MPVSETQREEAKRVRSAVSLAEYGSSLFPRWTFHVSASRRRLTVRAPSASIAAAWEWEEGAPGVQTVEQACVGVDLLVCHYLERVLDEDGIDLAPMEA